MITYAFVSRFQRMQVSARSLFSLTRASWRETLVLMVVAWLVPFLVHLVPWSGPRPLGVHMLPAFWTAFVAVYLYGGGVGVLVALVVPVVNTLTTGLPVSDRVLAMSVELIAYVALAALAVRRWPSLRLVAPLAWLPAYALSLGGQWAVPTFGYARDPIAHFGGTLANVWPGLVVLFVVNTVLVRLLPKDADWDAE
ncbi:MAG TPA: hypothetical protein VK477_12845 [Acidobacteriota bacterium]|nr:hypothetical protein [Acidobacteriota bacterium]